MKKTQSFSKKTLSMDFEKIKSNRIKTMKNNAIREILKVISKPEMISLAGGIPAPESFPMETMGEITKTVLAKYSSSAFQYDATEGFLPFRKALASYLKKRPFIPLPMRF